MGDQKGEDQEGIAAYADQQLLDQVPRREAGQGDGHGRYRDEDDGNLVPRPGRWRGHCSFPATGASWTIRSVGETIEQISPEGFDLTSYAKQANDYVYDLSAFDFQKWKKCTSKVLNDYPQLLLYESDVQGEAALRYEISRYVYSSRGVTASPDRIVIDAG